MISEEIARMFEQMADILEIRGVAWKPRAYRLAAKAISNVDISEVYKKGGIQALEDIPGIGERLAKKIVQYIKTGKINEYVRLRKTLPKGLTAIMDVPGMGPKKAYALYKKLNIKSITDLKKAISHHKVQNIFGFGAVSEEKIKESLGFAKGHNKERVPINQVIPYANKIISEMKMPELKRIEAVGSLRRKEATIGDIDFLAISDNPAKIMERFTTLPEVSRVIAKGQKKSVVILKNGMQSDLRVFEEKSFGAAMQYFTGNKLHNIELRKIAIKKKLKLNEYGLFKGNKMIAGKTEEEVYKALGLKYIPPEKRMDKGELEEYKL